MGYPDMQCLHVSLWVHHLEIDTIFDFINKRTDKVPVYWLAKEQCPPSITGGYAEISVSYNTYSVIRRVRLHGTFNS
jgi:hypothetical protein|tara:strand:- start:378 stop:608 length:231 start_codon:yes stop_codon:yes gene_type:complete